MDRILSAQNLGFMRYRYRLHRTLFTMRLTVFLTLLTLVSISSKSFGQTVTLELKNATLETAFAAIQKATSYRFIYKETILKNTTPVSISFKDESLSSALDKLLAKQGLIYQIYDGTIVIKPEQAPSKPVKAASKAGRVGQISGKVTDEKGEPLSNISVRVKANALFGTITDAEGLFSMSNVPEKSILVFSSVGYQEVSIDIATKTEYDLTQLKVVMKKGDSDLDEVVVVALGVQKKVSVVGAISTVDPKELIAPTRSLTNQLAGRVAGVSFSQSSGQPGKDGANFIIRGINSVRGSSDPLVLIDGLKRNIDDVDPNDIESFSILKDASATAVYGLEGANGIIVITTKTGKISQKPSVNMSLSTSVNNATYKPDWIDAVKYAKMKNEAYVVRGKQKPYSDDIIAKFGDNDMDFYPNVDWYNALIKPNNLSHKGNFNIGGGGNVVTYYMSGGYYLEDGMFRGNLEKYNSNAKYSQFNFRSNLKADISPTTTLGLGFDGRYNTTTEPGQGTSNILNIINEINPTLFPTQYSNGTAPEESDGAVNPFSLLNKTGFIRNYSNVMSTNLNITQKLDFALKGLFFNGIAAFSKINDYTHQYIKDYQRHRPDFVNSYMGTGRDEQGNLVTINTTPDLDDKMRFVATPPSGSRTVEVQGSLNYAHNFGNDFAVTGLALYKQREYMADVPGGTGGELLINALPLREQSIAGRMTLGYKNRYFTDINFGASGSQMFTPDKRWSTFPSVGAGWLISEEKFWSGIKNVVNMFKLRGSYGIVGSTGGASRFGYLASTGPTDGYTFGFGGTAYSGQNIPGVGESRLEQLGLTWDKNKKLNFGVEIGLFNQFKAVLDIFRNTREDQLIDLNRLPATLGLPAVPQANLGKMYSDGFDLDVLYTKNYGDFRINYIRGILTYNKNTIVENGQLDPKMPYQSGIGLDYGRDLDYIALGLFKDKADIDNSPVQTWNTVLPGDIKYKDINGDGVITPEDRVWLGSSIPKWTYSLAIDISYKNWTFATRFIGKADLFRMLRDGRIPFNANGSKGAIYEVTYNDHWTPASYSGTTATENPNATYPRLAVGSDNTNNAQQSTFWTREATYVRLADMEIGYTWTPSDSKLPFKSIYFYGRGDNLATFSKFKDWNPEQTSSYAYPLKRTYSVGLDVKFKL
ncbi:TonB-dependent receptor [Pedobacter nutrimenti]|uniref:TonB-dependent receptor n=1 Tax=Pedobacter nutrimenti TaxID=1241337 RepID=UPI00292D89F7|nr:TonB-dependent receptor [Pedobacter nutrimenti]